MALSWETARTQCGAQSEQLSAFYLVNKLKLAAKFLCLASAGCWLQVSFRSALKIWQQIRVRRGDFSAMSTEIFESLSAFNRPLVRSIAGCQALLTAFNGHVFGIALKRTYTHTHTYTRTVVSVCCQMPKVAIIERGCLRFIALEFDGQRATLA